VFAGERRLISLERFGKDAMRIQVEQNAIERGSRLGNART